MSERAALIALVLSLCLVVPALPARAGQTPQSASPRVASPQAAAQRERERRVVAEAIRRAGSRQKAEALALQGGWAKLKAGDSAAAIRYFKLASLIEPRNPDVLWGVGMALGRQHKFPEALKFLEVARRHEPGNAALLADYAYTWIGKGATADEGVAAREASFGQALKLLDASQKIDPRNPRVYTNRAMIRFFEARYAEAWAQVDKAQAIAPNSVDPRFLRDLSQRMPRPAK